MNAFWFSQRRGFQRAAVIGGNESSGRRESTTHARFGLIENRREKFGGVPERSKGSDCKSDGYAFEGSNPSPTTILASGPGKTGCSGELRERYAGMVQW